MRDIIRKVLGALGIVCGICVIAGATYASVTFIGDNDKVGFGAAKKVMPTVFDCPDGQAWYKGRCEKKCDRTVFSLTGTPEEVKGTFATCTDVWGTYYIYKSCHNGWDLIEGNCTETDCTGFPYTTAPESIAGTVTSCKSGTKMFYKYLSCKEGWDLSNGKCNIHACSSTTYPYTSKPSSDAGTIVTCKTGTATQYGYSSCRTGWDKSNGYCNIHICDSATYPYTTAQNSDAGTVISCKTGNDMRYGYTACNNGWIFASNQCTINACNGYNSTSASITGCKQNASCQKGPNTVYQCTTCYTGYTKNSQNNCTMSCTFTATSLPSNCSAASNCKRGDASGDKTYYATTCSSCKSNYYVNSGSCSACTWGGKSLTSCPNGCDCSSESCGGTTKYAVTRIKSGIKFVYSGDTIKFKYSASNGFVDWGDGTTETLNNGGIHIYSGVSHNFSDSSSHTVTFYGNIRLLGIDSSSTPNITQLLDINLEGLESAENLFDGAYNMTGDLSSMTLPSTLTDGSYMFRLCVKLTGNYPTLPNKLTKATGMFQSTRLSGTLILPNSLTDGGSMFYYGHLTKIPTLPSGLTNGAHMFYGCTGLTGKIPSLPNSLTDGSYMFAGNGGLTGNIPSLPNSLTNATYMFSGNSGLTGSIPTLPNSLTNGAHMFDSCTGLTGKIPTLPNSLTNGSYMFYKCSNLTGITNLPSNLTNGSYMFVGCKSLTGSIPSLPDSLTDSTYMFSGCSGLTGNIPTLPSSLTSGSGMFSGCTGLTGKIPALPNRLYSGAYMFNGCTGLTGNVPALPNGLKKAYAMFNGCTGLTGMCPQKPSSLSYYNDYSMMYYNTDVTCSYGAAPHAP